MTSIKKNDIYKCIEYAKENNLFDELNKIYESVTKWRLHRMWKLLYGICRNKFN